MFVVVTTFYTLESMKSILLPKFVFFSFKATPFTSKIQIYYSVVYSIIFMGVALHIITCPPPSRGRLGLHFAQNLYYAIGVCGLKFNTTMPEFGCRHCRLCVSVFDSMMGKNKKDTLRVSFCFW